MKLAYELVVNSNYSLGLNVYIILVLCRHSDSEVDIPASSNAAYELTKITEATYE